MCNYSKVEHCGASMNKQYSTLEFSCSLYNSSMRQCFTTEVSVQSMQAMAKQGLLSAYCHCWRGLAWDGTTICPTNLSAAALANCKLSLNTAWFIVHIPYVSLYVPTIKRNLCHLLCSACLHIPVYYYRLAYIQ